LRIARELGITDLEQLRTLQLGVILHDIGKIGVADTILLKPGSLTNEEHREMQKHTTYGYKALKNLPFIDEAALVVRHHHENYDGSGYPMGLKGEDIPLGARIFKVADVFDALASHRPHKQPWTYEDICREFTRLSGIHYDPQVVEAFLKIPSEEWEAIRARSDHFIR
jgi:HD-GYP domain-containing protein (c-di-GMP phosphodiesterase class II)